MCGFLSSSPKLSDTHESFGWIDCSLRQSSNRFPATVAAAAAAAAAAVVVVDDGPTRNGVTDRMQWLEVVHFKSRYLRNRKRPEH